MTGSVTSAGACSADLACWRCDLLVGLDGLHVTFVEEAEGRRGPCLRVRVESPARIQNTLRCGAERLTDKQKARLEKAFAAAGRHVEVEVAWPCAQQLRAAYKS